MPLVLDHTIVVGPRPKLLEKLPADASEWHDAWFARRSFWQHPYVGDHDYLGQGADQLSRFKLGFLATLHEFATWADAELSMLRAHWAKKPVQDEDDPHGFQKERFDVAVERLPRMSSAVRGLFLAAPLGEEFFDEHWRMDEPVVQDSLRVALPSLSRSSLEAVVAEDISRKPPGGYVSRSPRPTLQDHWQLQIDEHASRRKLIHEFCYAGVHALCEEFGADSVYLHAPDSRKPFVLATRQTDPVAESDFLSHVAEELRKKDIRVARDAALVVSLEFCRPELRFTFSIPNGTRTWGKPKRTAPKMMRVCEGRYLSDSVAGGEGIIIDWIREGYARRQHKNTMRWL